MTASSIDVLVIDDDKGMLRLLVSILEGEGFRVTSAEAFPQAARLLELHAYDVVLCDIKLGEVSGLDLVHVGRRCPKIPMFIFITGHLELAGATEALKQGALDYLPKPLQLDELRRIVLGALGRAAMRLEKAGGESRSVSTSSSPVGSMVGQSVRMAEVYRSIARAGLSRGNVIILGETGTGKELVARLIHENSDCQRMPFVAVNCAALSDTLLESELFGHVKGAFTGAVGTKRGLFEEANGGVLFLDEIGDISASLQVKLLRSLQSGEIKPVGASQAKRVDVRVIAATHRNLPECVGQGRFREDLYYRLKVFLIELPALRERKDDIPELVEYFIQRSQEASRKGIQRISLEALKILEHYRWPGNIRELENVITRVIASASEDTIFPDDLPAELHAALGSNGETPNGGDFASGPVSSPARPISSLCEMEQLHIIQALRATGFRMAETARLLGISRVTLYRKTREYGILPLRSRGQ